MKRESVNRDIRLMERYGFPATIRAIETSNLRIEAFEARIGDCSITLSSDSRKSIILKLWNYMSLNGFGWLDTKDKC